MTNPTVSLDEYTYDHIPQLRELLEGGGLPGVTYLQVTVGNMKQAQLEGWNPIHRWSMAYTIVGPSGRVDCMLLAQGKPIPAMSAGSGRRICKLDPEIMKTTGLPNNGSTEAGNMLSPSEAAEPESESHKPPETKPPKKAA